ncbi:MAG: ComF family protein [Nitrospirota bacterium]
MRKSAPTKHALILRLFNLFFPAHCPVCGKDPDVLNLSPFCSACWSLIAPYTGPSCRVCALPLVSEHGRVCGACLKEPPPFSRTLSFGLYDGVLADAINRLKFFGHRRLSGPLGELLINLDVPQTDGVVPIPLHKKSLRKRGFNQSLLIARVIARDMKAPVLMDTLFKIKETAPQVGLSAQERSKNLRNAFAVKGDVKDKRLLLVDDVMTTGATVRECSKQLINAGAKDVVVLTLARAGKL